MRAVARGNESFNATFTAADTDGDRIPDRNLGPVYDALYETNPEAAERATSRTDGEYRALRLGFYTDGTESNRLVASEMQESAAMVDDHPELTATATGRPIIRAAVQQQLFTTILRGFGLTLAIVFTLLVVVYRVTRGSASLGVVTMLPVLFAVAWILGTMAALGLRFNVLTALITSFTIGLGVDYSIHISERYVQELDRQGSVRAALRKSVFGTGGALLGSALTTAGGFGVLVFAILGPLRQFGLITAMTIVYAFVGSVVILPSLLVLWTRYVHGAEVPQVEQSRPLLGWRPNWWRE
jgi:predicted RND superfamily exporter protein